MPWIGRRSSSTKGKGGRRSRHRHPTLSTNRRNEHVSPQGGVKHKPSNFTGIQIDDGNNFCGHSMSTEKWSNAAGRSRKHESSEQQSVCGSVRSIQIITEQVGGNVVVEKHCHPSDDEEGDTNMVRHQKPKVTSLLLQAKQLKHSVENSPYKKQTNAVTSIRSSSHNEDMIEENDVSIADEMTRENRWTRGIRKGWRKNEGNENGNNKKKNGFRFFTFQHCKSKVQQSKATTTNAMSSKACDASNGPDGVNTSSGPQYCSIPPSLSSSPTKTIPIEDDGEDDTDENDDDSSSYHLNEIVYDIDNSDHKTINNQNPVDKFCGFMEALVCSEGNTRPSDKQKSFVSRDPVNDVASCMNDAFLAVTNKDKRNENVQIVWDIVQTDGSACISAIEDLVINDRNNPCDAMHQCGSERLRDTPPPSPPVSELEIKQRGRQGKKNGGKSKACSRPDERFVDVDNSDVATAPILCQAQVEQVQGGRYQLTI